MAVVVRALVVAALIASTLSMGSASLAAAPQGNQGLQDGWAVDDDGKITGGLHLLADGQFQFMRQAGAGWTRVNFRLGNCFPDWTTRIQQSRIDTGDCHPSTLGRTAVDQYTDVIRVARGQGLRILGLLSNETWRGDPSQWVANNAEHHIGSGDNAYIRGFAQAAGLLAGHFDGQPGPIVEEWEVWNEPNGWTENPAAGEYGGGTFIYPSNFAWMLQRTTTAIRTANRGAVVVSGGLLGHDQGAAVSVAVPKPGASSGSIQKRGAYARSLQSDRCISTVDSGAAYLCDTYRMGYAQANWSRGRTPFDHVGQHLYIDQGGPTSTAKIQRYVEDVRQAYSSFELAGSRKEIEITEFGWRHDWTGEATQAQNLRTAYEAFRPNVSPSVRRAYWFRTQDLPWDYHGLVNFEWEPDPQPKPAFYAYQAAANY